MDRDLLSLLQKDKIDDKTIQYLIEEEISSLYTFKSLKDDHFVRLLKRRVLSIGQHALLWDCWQRTVESSFLEKTGRFVSKGLEQTESSSQPALKPLSPTVIDRQELFEKYKLKMKDKRQSSEPEAKKAVSATKKKMSIHVGSMIYDETLKRGVLKKHLPGPRIVDFAATTSYKDFISTVKPLFFENEVAGEFGLANSSGIPYEVDNSADWVLQEFVKNHGPPSKLRVYLLHYPALLENLEEQNEKYEEPFAEPARRSKMKTVKAVKRECTECEKEFIAPVQDSICVMPDGSLVTRNDHINLCPLCDNDGYGMTWNLYFMEDLEPYRANYPFVDPYTVD